MARCPPLPSRPHPPSIPVRTPLGLAAAVALLLAGCAGGPGGRGPGRDGPGTRPTAELRAIPDAQPRIEAVRSGGPNKPYAVLGRSYQPLQGDAAYREQGLASWYGRAFHGKSTASGEPYDMYAMSAAHPTLPIPSYVRVRNPASGAEAILRVNDRGPFHDGRIIDLSYTAALKLGLLRGVAPVEVERITWQDIRTGAWQRGGPAPASESPPPIAMPMAAAGSAPNAGAAGAGGTSTGISGPAAPLPDSLDGAIELPARLLPADAVVGVALQPQDRLRAAPPPPVPAGEPSPERPPATAAASGRPSVGASSSAAPSDGPAAGPAAPTAGFWVQLGAFGSREGAERLQARAEAGTDTAPGARFAIVSEGGLHRLQAGPFASRTSARDAADRLRLSPVVVERR